MEMCVKTVTFTAKWGENTLFHREKKKNFSRQFNPKKDTIVMEKTYAQIVLLIITFPQYSNLCDHVTIMLYLKVTL